MFSAEHAMQLVCPQRLGPMVEHLRYNKNVVGKYAAEAGEIYNQVVDQFFEDFAWSDTFHWCWIDARVQMNLLEMLWSVS